VAVQAAVKRNRSSSSPARPKSTNRHLEARAKALAELKGYVTNLKHPMAKYVVVAHHQLWQIGHSFRMSKTDLRARPIYTTGGAAGDGAALSSNSAIPVHRHLGRRRWGRPPKHPKASGLPGDPATSLACQLGAIEEFEENAE